MVGAELQSTRKLVRGLESQVARQRHIAESMPNDGDRKSALTVLHLLEETLATEQDRLEALERLRARH